jgi:hypothetical protein
MKLVSTAAAETVALTNWRRSSVRCRVRLRAHCRGQPSRAAPASSLHGIAPPALVPRLRPRALRRGDGRALGLGRNLLIGLVTGEAVARVTDA